MVSVLRRLAPARNDTRLIATAPVCVSSAVIPARLHDALPPPVRRSFRRAVLAGDPAGRGAAAAAAGGGVSSIA